VEFGEWLTRARLQLAARRGRKITQAEVARQVGISRAYYGFLETGINPTTGKPVAVDKDLVERLARALDASKWDALRAAGFGEQLADDEADMLRRYRSLDQRTAEGIRRMLEALVPNRPPMPA